MMKKRHERMAGALSLLLSVYTVGCATGGLTRQDVYHQYEQIDELRTGLTEVEGNQAELLAPEGHETAQSLLDEAIDHGLDANKNDANKAVEQGLEVLAEIREHMDVATDELSEVLDARYRAKAEGAKALYETAFAEADKGLKEATRLIESGQVSEARKRRPELMSLYADLEVKALKEGTRAAAEAAVEKAEEMAADRWAPQTFEKAVDQLALVSSVLEADRTNTEKANRHARKAIWLADRAAAITEVIAKFKKNDYELEDIVLWHQRQVGFINEPIRQELPFDESDAAAVQSVRESIEALLDTLDVMRDSAKEQRQRIAALSEKLEQQRAKHDQETKDLIGDHQKQLSELKQRIDAMKQAKKKELSRLQKEASEQLSTVKASYEKALLAQSKAEAEAERKRKARQKRFDDVQALFDEDEATVSRQGDNIIINAHGFDFPRGVTDIGAKNFGILDKIVSAVGLFPKSKVTVTGHTDSSGGKDRNLRLSIERAESVTAFLTTVGKIDADRVQSKGAGEEKPVASNNDREGRVKNRRIEVAIVNAPQQPPVRHEE